MGLLGQPLGYYDYLTFVALILLLLAAVMALVSFPYGAARTDSDQAQSSTCRGRQDHGMDGFPWLLCHGFMPSCGRSTMA